MLALLGVDLGTSSFKASAYRDTGECLGTVSVKTPWRRSANGFEMGAAEFTRVLHSLVDACATRCGVSAVAGVAVTGMAETMFVETSDSRVLPARAWNDQRGEDATLPDAELFRRTGLLEPARTPAVALRQITEGGASVRSWSGLPEYAVQTMGGSPAAERSLAARSGLVDVDSGEWSAALLGWAGVGRVIPPPLQPAGTSSGVVRRDGPCRGAVLSVAGHDHLVARLGAGADDDVSVFDSLGTGEAVIAQADRGCDAAAPLAAAGLNVSLGLREHDVVAVAGLGTGNRFNLVLQALGENGFGRDRVLDPPGRPDRDLEDLLAMLPAAAASFVEALGGPEWRRLREDAAALVGRTIGDLAAARVLWWAVVARMTANTADVLDTFARLAPRALHRVAAGGWLGNAGIRAVRERHLGPFDVPAVGQCGTRGAALLAGLAAGVYSSRADFPPLPEEENAA